MIENRSVDFNRQSQAILLDKVALESSSSTKSLTSSSSSSFNDYLNRQKDAASQSQKQYEKEQLRQKENTSETKKNIANKNTASDLAKDENTQKSLVLPKQNTKKPALSKTDFSHHEKKNEILTNFNKLTQKEDSLKDLGKDLGLKKEESQKDVLFQKKMDLKVNLKDDLKELSSSKLEVKLDSTESNENLSIESSENNEESILASYLTTEPLNAEPSVNQEVDSSIELNLEESFNLPKTDSQAQDNKNGSQQHSSKESMLEIEDLRTPIKGSNDASPINLSQNTNSMSQASGKAEINWELARPQELSVQNAMQQLDKLLQGKGSQQLSEKIHVLLNDNSQAEIKLNLRPDNLGSVRVLISMQENALIGKIIVDNPSVRQSFMNNLDQLQSSLQASGFDITNLDVSLGGGESQSSFQQEEKKFQTQVHKTLKPNQDLEQINNFYNLNTATDGDRQIQLYI